MQSCAEIRATQQHFEEWEMAKNKAELAEDTCEPPGPMPLGLSSEDCGGGGTGRGLLPGGGRSVGEV
jgi:hypothetical protein